MDHERQRIIGWIAAYAMGTVHAGLDPAEVVAEIVSACRHDSDLIERARSIVVRVQSADRRACLAADEVLARAQAHCRRRGAAEDMPRPA